MDHPTVKWTRHVLADTLASLRAVDEGLNFLAGDEKRKIIYLVDYTEIRAHWDTAFPTNIRSVQQEPRDSQIERVYSYLSSLERLALGMQDDPENEYRYIQRTYLEQAEYIEFLLLNRNLKTLITSDSWNSLKADVLFYLYNDKGAFRSWNSAQTDQFLRLDTKEDEELSKTRLLYEENFEKAGYLSLNRKLAKTLNEVIRPFLRHSEFYLLEDFPWQEVAGASKESAEHIANPEILHDLSPKREKLWEKHFRNGGKLFSDASANPGGVWRHLASGISTLSLIDAINNMLEKEGRNVQVSLVTRNRQYHTAQMSWQSQAGWQKEKFPLIFHPRFLTAYMIRQAVEADKGSRRIYAQNARRPVRDLIGTIISNDNLVKTISLDQEQKVGSGLARLLSRELNKAFEEFRRVNHREKLRLRITARKSEWQNHPLSKIRSFLDKIISDSEIKFGAKLAELQSELALLKALPHGKELKGYLNVSQISLENFNTNEAIAYLFSSEKLTHPFRFYSKDLINALTENTGSAFDQLVSQAILEVERLLSSTDFDNSLNRARALRFDLLFLHAIILAIGEKIEDSCLNLELAERVWMPKWRENTPNLSAVAKQQLLEAKYLNALLDRQKWRQLRRRGRLKNRAIWLDGIQKLRALIAQESSNQELASTFRFEIFICGFMRELYRFSLEKNLRPKPEEWPLSISETVRKLDSLIEKTDNFPYIKLRAIQQFLAFILIKNEFRSRKLDIEPISRSKEVEMFDNFRELYHSEARRVSNFDDIAPISILVTKATGLIYYQPDGKKSLKIAKDILELIDRRRDRDDGRNYHFLIEKLHVRLKIIVSKNTEAINTD
ncbi:MAG: hypothetical protein JKY77_06945 [Rhizobiaceae bacterium]|nr:hypothetical protein [Rhizobiaceae bacterium]